VWLPIFINRAQNAADPLNPSFGLFLLNASILSLQGALNAIVYGVNEKFIDWYHQCLTGRSAEGSKSSSEGIPIEDEPTEDSGRFQTP